MHLLEAYLRCTCIRLIDRFLQGRCGLDDAEHTTAVGIELSIAEVCTCDVDIVHLIDTRDLEAGLVGHRISAGCLDDTAGGFILPLHLDIREATLGDGLHDGQQVRIEQRQHDLCLRIAEAAVVLDHLRAILRQHETEVEAAPEGAALALHRFDGRLEDGLHADLGDLLRVVRVRCDGAHTAGIEALIVVVCTLVIHGADHRYDHVTIRKAEDGHLRTLEVLLDDDLIAGVAELVLCHDGLDALDRLLTGHRDDDTLAEGESVRLDDGRDRAGLDIRLCGVDIGKYLIARGRDVVLLHQVLREYLRTLDDRCLALRSEGRDTGSLECIDHARNERIIRCDDHIIQLLLDGELYDALDIGCLDLRYTLGIPCDTAVARDRIELLDRRILSDCFDDGMLTSATTYDANSHRLCLLFTLLFTDFLTHQLGCGRQKLPLRLLHHALLKDLRRIALLDRDGLLEKDTSAIRDFVYEMYGCTGHLHTVGECGLMRAKPVHALAAEARDQGRMDVDDAICIRMDEIRTQDRQIAGQDDEVNAVGL